MSNPNTTGNLAWKTSDEDLLAIVQTIGKSAISASVQRHSDTSRSKGWGLIEFADPESANAAVNSLNSSMLNDRQVYLRLDRGAQDSKTKGLGLFVGNIPWNTTKEELMDLFAHFNPTECILKSRGFGILVFDSEEDVKKAIENMHMKDFNGRILECHVDNGHKNRKKRSNKVSKLSIFVGNLSSEMDDDKTAAVFSEAGKIVSISIKHTAETNKTWGIIQYATEEESAAAVQLFNGSVRPGATLPWIVRFDRK